MVPDHFIDDETQKFFGEIRVELGIAGELPEPFDLTVLARGVCRWQARSGLVLTDGLRNFEAFSKHEHQCSIDIIDAVAVTRQNSVVAHGTAVPRELVSDKENYGFCTCLVAAPLAVR